MESEHGGARESFRESRPPRPLARHVACVWVQQVTPESMPYTYRTVPNGSAEVVCTLGSLPRVIGPQMRPTAAVIAPGTTVVGVRLRPGAARAVLGVPARELVDRELGADELWGASTVALAERMAAAPSALGAAAVLAEHVGRRLVDAPELDPVATEAVRRLLPRQAIGMGSLAAALHLSERQLRRRFEAATGLAPKTLQQMLRFQRFLALAAAQGRPSGQLARLAAEAGYADQAHLSREALRLGGRPPGTIVAEARQHCGHAHDHAASYEPLLAAR